MSDKIELASELCADALINTKSFTEIFRGYETDRRANFKFFFNINLHTFWAKDADSLRYFYSENGELECFFILMPIKLTKFSLCEHISSGALKVPFVCGFDVFNRLMKLGDYVDKMEEDLLKDRPEYLKLNRMVVNPKQQG